MLIKKADDKSKRIHLLKSIGASALLDERQRKRVDKALHALQTGAQGECHAAHYTDNHSWKVLGSSAAERNTWTILSLAMQH